MLIRIAEIRCLERRSRCCDCTTLTTACMHILSVDKNILTLSNTLGTILLHAQIVMNVCTCQCCTVSQFVSGWQTATVLPCGFRLAITKAAANRHAFLLQSRHVRVVNGDCSVRWGTYVKDERNWRHHTLKRRTPTTWMAANCHDNVRAIRKRQYNQSLSPAKVTEN